MCVSQLEAKRIDQTLNKQRFLVSQYGMDTLSEICSIEFNYFKMSHLLFSFNCSI